MQKIQSRVYGLLLVAGAAVLWSTAGVFVRLIDLDVWTVLAWRSVFAALSLAIVVVATHGRGSIQRVRANGWPGLLAVPFAVISMSGYVVALKFTTVANVMVVYATVPLVAAAIAYFWIRENVGSRFVLTSAIALVGIIVMARNATRPQDVAGNAVAFLMTLAFGVQLVIARRFRSLEMAPVNAVSAAVLALLCWPFIAPGIPSGYHLAVLALFGITTTSLAYILFLTGARHIPSGEAGLIALLDVVLGPLWVWLAFNEQPGKAAIIGGALVIAPVMWYLSAGQRRAPD